MRILATVFAFLSLTVFASAHSAVITDGNSLAEGLRQFERAVGGDSVTAEQGNSAVAAGAYISGFLGACGMWQIMDKNGPFRLPTTGVQPMQAIKIVEKWLNDHPEELHGPADALCFVALSKAFPNPDYKK